MSERGMTVVRVFTPARRIHRMIGKFTDGHDIPFGPYTLPQAAAACGGFVLTVAACKMISPWAAIVLAPLTILAVVALAFAPDSQIPIFHRIGFELRFQTRRRPRLVGGTQHTSPDQRLGYDIVPIVGRPRTAHEEPRR